MLNFDVKRKINTLRDILVGKVPDPKAQVEQITIALIYKFMDDIDQQGADFGEITTTGTRCDPKAIRYGFVQAKRERKANALRSRFAIF